MLKCKVRKKMKYNQNQNMLPLNQAYNQAESSFKLCFFQQFANHYYFLFLFPLNEVSVQEMK